MRSTIEEVHNGRGPQSPDTVNPKESNQSEVKKHIFGCDECKKSNLSVENFSIKKQCRDDYSARISEALMIKQLQPKINNQKLTDSYLLGVF